MPPITFRGDTIFVIYIHQKNLYVQEEFEDTKEVIRIRKNEEEHTTQWPEEERTNSNIQNITHQTKD
jgi:hypothetical protein